MKLPALTATCLALASAAFADNAGSYAPVTIALTLTDHVTAPPVVLPNGNRQYTSTRTTFKVTNAAILAECQRQGYLTAGSISGWRIYAVYDRDQFVDFVISNGLNTLAIPNVLDRSSSLTGFNTKAKWTTNTNGVTVSGTSTFSYGFVLSVTINGVEYLSTVVQNASDKIVSFGVLADPVWQPGAWKMTVIGLPDDEDENSILQGSISIGASRSSWDLGLVLLGFDGFTTEN